MSRFIESILLDDGVPSRLDYHQRRVDSTFAYFYPAARAWNLHSVIGGVPLPAKGCCKCRVVYDDRETVVNVEPYTIQAIHTLKVVDGGNVEYAFKFANRSELNELFALRAGRDDILIVKNDLITDTSFCNIVLRNKSGEWHTPLNPLLKGTMRTYLLESGRILERNIDVKALRDYQEFKVINALRGWDTVPSDVSNID